MTLEQLKSTRMHCMIKEWEMRLREKVKYSDETTTTWDAVRELYVEVRNEYLVVDLLDEELSHNE